MYPETQINLYVVMYCTNGPSENRHKFILKGNRFKISLDNNDNNNDNNNNNNNNNNNTRKLTLTDYIFRKP